MAVPLLVPIRVLGWAAAGVALGFGWHLGTYLFDAARRDNTFNEMINRLKCSGDSEKTPLWKRQFSKVSE